MYEEYDDYTDLGQIEPLETYVHHEDYFEKMSNEVKNLFAKFNQTNIKLQKEIKDLSDKVNSLASEWKSFIGYLQELDVDSGGGSDLKTIVRQNEEIIQATERLVESMGRSASRPSLSRSFSSKTSSDHEVAPRKYPKIRIVK